jgi:hypothetical protein
MIKCLKERAIKRERAKQELKEKLDLYDEIMSGEI